MGQDHQATFYKTQGGQWSQFLENEKDQKTNQRLIDYIISLTTTKVDNEAILA